MLSGPWFFHRVPLIRVITLTRGNVCGGAAPLSVAPSFSPKKAKNRHDCPDTTTVAGSNVRCKASWISIAKWPGIYDATYVL